MARDEMTGVAVVPYVVYFSVVGMETKTKFLLLQKKKYHWILDAKFP